MLCSLPAVAIGCGGSDKSSKTPTGRTATAEWPVRFIWSGGVAGLDYRLNLQENGAGVLTSGPPGHESQARFRLTASESADLRQRLADADLAHLGRTDYGPKSPVPDGFVFSIEADGRTVHYGDGGDPVPPAVGRLSGTLRQLTTRYAGQTGR